MDHYQEAIHQLCLNLNFVTFRISIDFSLQKLTRSSEKNEEYHKKVKKTQNGFI